MVSDHYRQAAGLIAFIAMAIQSHKQPTTLGLQYGQLRACMIFRLLALTFGINIASKLLPLPVSEYVKVERFDDDSILTRK